MKIKSLPRLPFGNAMVQHSTDIKKFRDMLAREQLGDWEIEPVGKERFAFKSSSIQVGTTSLFSGISTAVFDRLDEQPFASLLLPFFGHFNIRVGREQFSLDAGRHGMLVSGAPWEGGTEDTAGSVAIALDASRLATVMAAMQGGDHSQNVMALLQQDRKIPLQVGTMSFAAVLNNIFTLADIMNNQQNTLSLLTIDDLLYRCMAMMLTPNMFFASQPLTAAQKSHGRSRLDIVCEYIQSRIDEPITLTELENFSGLSARSLQYAFAKQFQCTPLEWIRNTRLRLARERLSIAKPDQTVLSVALSCGFSNPGRFANQYLKLFGEPPFATLLRSISA